MQLRRRGHVEHRKAAQQPLPEAVPERVRPRFGPTCGLCRCVPILFCILPRRLFCARLLFCRALRRPLCLPLGIPHRACAVVQPVVQHAHQQAAALPHREQAALGIVAVLIDGPVFPPGRQVAVRVPSVQGNARARRAQQAPGPVVQVHRRALRPFFLRAAARRIVGVHGRFAVLRHARKLAPLRIGIAALYRFAVRRNSLRRNIARGVVGVRKRRDFRAPAVVVRQRLHTAGGIVCRRRHAAVRARHARHVALRVVCIERLAAVAPRHPYHAAQRVVLVGNGFAVRIGNLGKLAVLVVGVAHRGVKCVRIRNEPPGIVIRERAAARRVVHRNKCAVRIVGIRHARVGGRSCVCFAGCVCFSGARVARRIAFFHQPVERIVIVGNSLAAGQRGVDQIARRIVAVRRRFASGVRRAQQLPRKVVAIGRCIPAAVRAGNKISHAVVAVARNRPRAVRKAHKPVQRVVRIACPPVFGVGNRRHIAVRVVPVLRQTAQRVRLAHKPAGKVVGIACLRARRVRGREHAVHAVVRKAHRLAQRVGNAGDIPVRVVGKRCRSVLRLGDLRQVPHRVVDVLRQAARRVEALRHAPQRVIRIALRAALGGDDFRQIAAFIVGIARYAARGVRDAR